MKTLDSFIVERLKINKDTKIVSNYVLFIWAVGNNYYKLQSIYRNNKNSNQFYTVINKDGIIGYVCDIDFFNDNINQKWRFGDYHIDSIMLKIPINEIDEVIEYWKKSKDASTVLEKLKKKYTIINKYADIR